MKVLIVSHNVMCRTGGMGKTLMSYFSGFAPDEIAQFYIGSEVPTERSVCRNYFRLTDGEVLRARLPGRAAGRQFRDEDIETGRDRAGTDTGVLTELHQLGRRRTPLIYAARNAMWKTGFWRTEKLKRWVLDFAPDVIFFASGDYAFMYDAALWMAELTGQPLVIGCVDDFYLNNTNAGRFGGAWAHGQLMRSARRAMKRASCAFTICDSMSEAYASLFGIRCHTLYTAAAPRTGRNALAKSGPISYAGTLGHGRHRSIMAVGEALSCLALPDGPREICVYSAESRPEILSQLQAAKGVRFCGRLSAEGVERVMRESMAMLHAEAFDDKEMARVRFSVSTKIADSLMNGPCLIAYGPEGIASIDYLRAHQAAWVISDPDALETALYRILTEPALRAETVANARALAEANHRADAVSAKVRAWLQEVIEA